MKKIISALVVISMSGCATYGDKDYSCKGLPDGVRCMSASDVYANSHGGTKPKSQKKEKSDYRSARDPYGNSVQGDHLKTNQSDQVINTFVTPNLPDRPVPIRTPAGVMRIWVASWEDTKSGALISPGYIYTEIESRRWVIGKPETAAEQQSRLFKPLEQSSNQSSSTQDQE